MQVLAINQNATIDRLISLSSGKMGYTLHQFQDLESALQDNYNFTLIDSELYQDGNIDTIKSIAPNATHIIIMSKNAPRPDGFDIYLEKPFLPTELVDIFSREQEKFLNPAPIDTHTDDEDFHDLSDNHDLDSNGLADFGSLDDASDSSSDFSFEEPQELSSDIDMHIDTHLDVPDSLSIDDLDTPIDDLSMDIADNDLDMPSFDADEPQEEMHIDTSLDMPIEDDLQDLAISTPDAILDSGLDDDLNLDDDLEFDTTELSKNLDETADTDLDNLDMPEDTQDNLEIDSLELPEVSHAQELELPAEEDLSDLSDLSLDDLDLDTDTPLDAALDFNTQEEDNELNDEQEEDFSDSVLAQDDISELNSALAEEEEEIVENPNDILSGLEDENELPSFGASELDSTSVLMEDDIGELKDLLNDSEDDTVDNEEFNIADELQNLDEELSDLVPEECAQESVTLEDDLKILDDELNSIELDDDELNALNESSIADALGLAIDNSNHSDVIQTQEDTQNIETSLATSSAEEETYTADMSVGIDALVNALRTALTSDNVTISLTIKKNG